MRVAHNLLNAVILLILIKLARMIPPTDFKSVPTTVKAPENDTVLLPCYLDNIDNDGTNHNRVKWFKDGELIADSGPPQMPPPNRYTLWSNGSLQVIDITPLDTAEFICEVMRPTPGSIVKQVHAIEVLHAPTAIPDPINGFLEVRLGDEVQISCKTFGVPYPVMTWFYNGKEMQLIDNREMLKFQAGDRHLAGEYRCMARNGVGQPAIASIVLNIVYPPELMAPRPWLHTAPGVRTQLDCIVSADPQASVSWLKGEKPVVFSSRVIPMVDGEKNILLIRNATFSDFGIYTCRASNDLGQGEVQIQLSGIANPGVFKHIDQRSTEDPKHSYTLIWEVDSYAPVIEYKLWFRVFRPRNDIRNTDWTTLTIPAERSSGPVHSKSYTIGGLKEKTIYEALLTSRNRYGWSKPSVLLQFSTDGADFKEEVITPVQVELFEEFVPIKEVRSSTVTIRNSPLICIYIFLIYKLM